MNKFIDEKSQHYNSIVVYGAGCRSICITSFLGLSSRIKYFIDDSQAKYGKYEPCSKIEIIHSEKIDCIGKTFFLLGVNSEIEHKIINRLSLIPEQYASILPPSTRIPKSWIDETLD